MGTVNRRAELLRSLKFTLFSASAGTIQQATRRYAKRQMTWFRANPAVQWLDASAGADEIFRAALQKAADFDSGI